MYSLFSYRTDCEGETSWAFFGSSSRLPEEFRPEVESFDVFRFSPRLGTEKEKGRSEFPERPLLKSEQCEGSTPRALFMAVGAGTLLPLVLRDFTATLFSEISHRINI
jgi:hypothetical protein